MNQFEKDLRSEVKRRSRWKDHDLSIQEISQHFQDVFDEYIADGLTAEEAYGQATRRFGDAKDVAKRLTTPTSRSKGIHAQWVAVTLWLFFLFSPLLIARNGYEIGSVWGNFIEFWTRLSDGAIVATGVHLAFGIFRAKRLAVFATVLGLVMIPLGWVGYNLMTFKPIARHDDWMKMTYLHMKSYASTTKPAFFERQNLVKDCLQTPTPDRLKGFAAIMQNKPLNSFYILGDKSGQWVYPTAFQNIREVAAPVIYFATTNSFDQAQKAWVESDKLKDVMPRMTTRAAHYFQDLDRIDYARMTLKAKTISFSIKTITRFAVSTGLGLLICGIFSATSGRIRPLCGVL